MISWGVSFLEEKGANSLQDIVLQLLNSPIPLQNSATLLLGDYELLYTKCNLVRHGKNL